MMKFQRLYEPISRGNKLIEYISIVQVYPTTSKGIIELLLP